MLVPAMMRRQLMFVCLHGYPPGCLPVSVQSIFYLLPIVDCSAVRAPDTATELDREVYSSTASMEEFVMTFLDRVFQLMKTQVAATTKRYSIERSLSSLLTRAVQGLFIQLSDSLRVTATKKVFRFVTTELILENAKHVGFLCYSAARADPKSALDMMLPFMASRVIDMAQSHARADEVDGDEVEVDDELVWYLSLIARLVKCTNGALLAHRDAIVDVLAATIPLASKQASKLAGKLLRHTLFALVGIYPSDYRSVAPQQYEQLRDDPIAMFDTRGISSARDGGDPDVRWHTPSTEEQAFAEELLAMFYNPAVAHLEGTIRLLQGPSSLLGEEGAAAAPPAPADSPDAAEHVTAINPTRLRVSLMVVRNVLRVSTGLLDVPNVPADEVVSKFHTKVACELPAIKVTMAPSLPADGGDRCVP